MSKKWILVKSGKMLRQGMKKCSITDSCLPTLYNRTQMFTEGGAIKIALLCGKGGKVIETSELGGLWSFFLY